MNEKSLTPTMLRMAKRMYAAWSKSAYGPAWGDEEFIEKQWVLDSQAVRDAWAAATVEAFMFMAEGAAGLQK